MLYCSYNHINVACITHGNCWGEKHIYCSITWGYENKEAGLIYIIEKQFVQLQLARLLRLFKSNPTDVRPKFLDWLALATSTLSLSFHPPSPAGSTRHHTWLTIKLIYSFLKPTLIIPLEPNPVTGYLTYLMDFLDDIAHLTMTKTSCKQLRS